MPIRRAMPGRTTASSRSMGVVFGRPRGKRLDIAPGTAVRFEPGSTQDVAPVPLSGGRTVYGFRGEVMGGL